MHAQQFTWIFVVGATVALAEPTHSLLRNGGFESLDKKTGAPSHWSCSDWSPKETRGTIRLASVEEGAFEGKRAARIQYEGKGGNLVVYQDVGRPGTGQYHLKAKCKAYGSARAYVSIVTFTGNKILQYENSKKVTGSATWQDLKLSITTDPNTERIRVILRANGKAAFDDVHLVMTGDDEAKPGSGAESRTKIIPATRDEQADLARKAKMSPAEVAWENVLEQNLGSFYLPLYKKAKTRGRTTAWDYVKEDPALPRVLLIGDSISRGYTVAVRTRLAGKVNLHRAPANCGSTGMGLKKLGVWLGDGKWDLIHFNFGIHDRNSKSGDYASRLERIVVRLKQTGAKLVWATSTPLPADSSKYKQGDCARLNASAAEVMRKHAVRTNDLYSAILPHLDRYQNPADCHFSGKGYKFLGERVAQSILKDLVRRGSGEPVHSETHPKLPLILKGVKRILFVGDSLTDGSSYPDYVVNTLNRLFPNAGFEIHNSAVAGDTAAIVRKRLQKDIIERTPDLMLLCIGTNDCSQNRPVKDYEDDVRFIVSETLKIKSKVMLVLPSPFGKINAAKEESFQAYLAVLRQIAADYKLPIADAHAEFVRGEKAGREMLGSDGIHHGKHGFEGMARAILDSFGFKNVKLDLEVRPWPGLLTQWESSSPVPRDKGYSPTEAEDWKPYDARSLMAKQTWWNAPFPARGGWMPFPDHNSKQVAYGRTYYDAKSAGKYELQVGGSPSPQIVWLNGEQVWKSGRPHGYHPNADHLIVNIKKGRNEIIVVSNFMIFVRIKKL